MLVKIAELDKTTKISGLDIEPQSNSSNIIISTSNLQQPVSQLPLQRIGDLQLKTYTDIALGEVIEEKNEEGKLNLSQETNLFHEQSKPEKRGREEVPSFPANENQKKQKTSKSGHDIADYDSKDYDFFYYVPKKRICMLINSENPVSSDILELLPKYFKGELEIKYKNPKLINIKRNKNTIEFFENKTLPSNETLETVVRYITKLGKNIEIAYVYSTRLMSAGKRPSQSTSNFNSFTFSYDSTRNKISMKIPQEHNAKFVAKRKETLQNNRMRIYNNSFIIDINQEKNEIIFSPSQDLPLKEFESIVRNIAELEKTTEISGLAIEPQSKSLNIISTSNLQEPPVRQPSSTQRIGDQPPLKELNMISKATHLGETNQTHNEQVKKESHQVSCPKQYQQTLFGSNKRTNTESQQFGKKSVQFIEGTFLPTMD